MKFLHLADIHLGRSLHEQSLEEDQRAMIDQLIAALAGDDWAGLILAGDIYDRSLPSKEAVSLLNELLIRIHDGFPALPVLMIPGNHDSARRLAYGQDLFSKLGIHIVADPEAAFEPVMIEKNGERCACFLLPFLEPGCLRAPGDEPAPKGEAAPKGNGGGTDGEYPKQNDAPTHGGEPLRSQRELHREAARRLEEARQKALAAGADYSLLVAHLFAGGARESESERHFLGTAELVDIGAYRHFDYVALGHLHRRQKAGANAWYAGSPLAWAFDEAGSPKGGLAVTLGAGKGDARTTEAGAAVAVPAGSEEIGPPRFSVEPIDFTPLHPLSRLSGRMDDFLDGRHDRREAGIDYREHYLEIQLEGDELVENPLALLRQKFPLLLSVRQDRAFEALSQRDSEESLPVERHGTQDLDADFERFLNTIYGEDHGREAEAALFSRLLEESGHTDGDHPDGGHPYGGNESGEMVDTADTLPVAGRETEGEGAE